MNNCIIESEDCGGHIPFFFISLITVTLALESMDAETKALDVEVAWLTINNYS